MKVKIHEVLTRKNRYKRLVFILVLFLLVLLVGILGFGLTKEKEKKVQKTEQFTESSSGKRWLRKYADESTERRDG